MKVLLVGFSPQNASVLAMLINRTHPEYHVEILERVFCASLKLCLPTLQEQHKDAKAMIINLDGVGMVRFTDQHPKELRDFIGLRVALMIFKGDISEWQHAKVLPKDVGFFLQSPYSKSIMETALSELFNAVDFLKASTNEFYRHQEQNKQPEPSNVAHQLKAKTIEPKSDNPEDKQTLQYVLKADPEKEFLVDLLDSHFNTPYTPIFHELLQITLNNPPIKMLIGTQTVYVDSRKNIALITSLDKLMDYCEVISGTQSTTNIVVSAPSVRRNSIKTFDELVGRAKEYGLERYALNALLWQLFSRILPEKIDIPDHDLLLKMQYMPNFALMKDIPSYVRAVVAYCLIGPKSLSDLHDNFQDDGITKSDINRVFLLAILSGVVDLEILRKSYEDSSVHQKSQRHSNDGVQKAQKTGFLKRFLNKLKF